ncbi:hypothetical protein [Blastococcus tunisiensis]|uniref:Uncharacterized protein n=1 Tax=Blastococcus tunisiensis TaxID=1798228 RepID=A0A1I1W0F0_9ACTN|nr:hypothetical protein [Blastococcus sp. DSM 46838]SFD88499.1 hypothetical protein SAMN05216574_101184 [Blastococcus sp. DSM 46838]
MSAELPDPVPLELPDGEPEAVEELVRDVDGAARRLGELADRLSGPAGAAPGWLGADAVAAAGQLARVVTLARESAAAVRSAAVRLGAHGELLRDARRQVLELRAEQDEDFRAAWQRIGQLEDPRLALMTGSPAWVGVVAEIEAAEARRRRRHALVLEELAHDAGATGRVLADATRPVGGTGRRGDGARVLAHLTGELPGWGRPELAARGRALADTLIGTPLTPEERAALVSDSAALAADPAFATAFVRGLGAVGVRLLLELLGRDPHGPGNPLAGVLAAALGTATPGTAAGDGVTAVLGATYVPADAPLGAAPAAAGMAAVLLAGTGSRGLRPATAGEWARQLLVREHVQQAPAGPVPPAWPAAAADPVAVAVRYVAHGGDPQAAAALLGDGRVWEAALARVWGDGGQALADLVAAAGRAGGGAGARAVQLGLETIGAGLVEGDPAGWTVGRGVVAAVSPALGDAVAVNVEGVAGTLAALSAEGAGSRAEAEGTGSRAEAEGTGSRAEAEARGLGYLTVDGHAAAAVERALAEWAGGRPAGSGTEPLPAVAVAAAYVAVQEYGQRLTYALDGFELRAAAEDRARLWNWTAGPLLEAVSFVRIAPVAVTAEILGAYGPLVLDMDNTFSQSPDEGPRLAAEDAIARARETLPPDALARAGAVAAQAEGAFLRVAERLGGPRAPVSAERDWTRATLELVTGGMADLATDGQRDRAAADGLLGPPRGRR